MTDKGLLDLLHLRYLEQTQALMFLLKSLIDGLPALYPTTQEDVEEERFADLLKERWRRR
jgi:hypothetical protein